MYGSVEKMSKVCLQLLHFRFVAAETLHEGCGGAGLVGSGGAGGGGGDIGAQGDFEGQASNQVCICTRPHKIFGWFYSESVSLKVELLVSVVE